MQQICNTHKYASEANCMKILRDMLNKKKILLFLFCSTMIFGQQAGIVSLIKGDYRLYYREYEDYTRKKISYCYLSKVVKDTLIGTKNCVKVANISFRDASNPTYSYLSSDNQLYLYFSIEGNRFDTLYNSAITKGKTLFSEYVSTQGYVTKYLYVGTYDIFNSRYKAQSYDFQSSKSQYSTTYAEKFGLVSNSSWYNGLPDHTRIIGAKINGDYYGKLAPLYNCRINIKNMTADLNFDVFDNTIEIAKILVYKADSSNNYVIYDSVSTSRPHYSKKLNEGNYDFKLAYITKNGMEGAISEAVKFEVKRPAPPANCRFTSNNRIINIQFDLADTSAAIAKLLVFKADFFNQYYQLFDTVSTTVPRYTKKLNAGNYNLKIAYITNFGIQSELSNAIRFEIVPEFLQLYQNYPNPFNGQTKIPFETRYTADIELAIYNMLGQVVYSAGMKTPAGGYYEFNVDLQNLPSGVYLYRISTVYDRVQFNKMLLLK